MSSIFFGNNRATVQTHPCLPCLLLARELLLQLSVKWMASCKLWHLNVIYRLKNVMHHVWRMIRPQNGLVSILPEGMQEGERNKR